MCKGILFNYMYIIIIFHIILFLQKHNNTRFLKCRYQNYGHPLLMIAPAKEEVIFDRPKLIMFREMLTDKEMKIIKGMAAPRVSDNILTNDLTQSGCVTTQPDYYFQSTPAAE